MLINFTVSNSRSIEKELTFSMIATVGDALQEALMPLPQYDIRLVKTAAIFGANASGKSNLLKAMADAKMFICKPIKQDENPSVFYSKNNTAGKTKPITYKFDILIENIHYTYAFSHFEDKIIEEFLSKTLPNTDKEVMIYHRKIQEDGSFTWLPNGFLDNKNNNFFYESTPKNYLYLTAVNTLPFNPDVYSKNIELVKVFNWFRIQFEYSIELIAAGINYNKQHAITYIQENNTNKQLFLKLLSIADSAIKDIQVTEYNEGVGGNIKYFKDGKLVYVTIQIFKETRGIKIREAFDLIKDESNGTEQLFTWLGYWLYNLDATKPPKIFVIDEFGTSLHPLLAQLLLKIFYSKKLNQNNSQFIFTTHETKLMDKTVLRPDQLYLVNKINNNTVIERAFEYENLEEYSRLDNLYMHGGISGIPSISKLNLDDLL